MEVMDKVVVITGASGGIGLATARLLAGKGAKLALVARSKDKLETLAEELPGSLAVPADMTEQAEIKSMIEQTEAHFGGIEETRATSLELFVGAGGLALSAAQTGFDYVAVIDWSRNACDTLHLNKAAGVVFVKDWAGSS